MTSLECFWISRSIRFRKNKKWFSLLKTRNDETVSFSCRPPLLQEGEASRIWTVLVAEENISVTWLYQTLPCIEEKWISFPGVYVILLTSTWSLQILKRLRHSFQTIKPTNRTRNISSAFPQTTDTSCPLKLQWYRNGTITDLDK